MYSLSGSCSYSKLHHCCERRKCNRGWSSCWFFCKSNDHRHSISTGFPYDCRNCLRYIFGISAIGNPNGMVNRKDYTSSTTAHVKSDGSWATEVATELAKPATAKLVITKQHNSGTRVLTCDVNSTFLYDTLTGGPYKLICYGAAGFHHSRSIGWKHLCP